MLQQPCQSHWDLDVYLASPAGGCRPRSLAELASTSTVAKRAQTDTGRATVRWALAARLVRPEAPDAWLFCAEECPSSFVIEAMGEPDVWGTAAWRINLSQI